MPCGVYIRKQRFATACEHTTVKHYAFGLCKPCWEQLPQNKEKARQESQNHRRALKQKLGKAGWTLYLRTRNLRIMYKVTPERYQALSLAQNHRCSCGKLFAEEQPHVDHDHGCCAGVKSCGKCVRGLLCSRCNTVLGLLDENPRLLPAYLLEYLDKYARVVRGLGNQQRIRLD
jgi:hypothetical protein